MAEDILAFQAGREAAINGKPRDARRNADWLEGYDMGPVRPDSLRNRLCVKAIYDIFPPETKLIATAEDGSYLVTHSDARKDDGELIIVWLPLVAPKVPFDIKEYMEDTAKSAFNLFCVALDEAGVRIKGINMSEGIGG